MNRALFKGNFADTVQTIIEQSSEDRAFEMYLAYSSNMMNEPISFSDYLHNVKTGTAAKRNAKESATEFRTKKEVEAFVAKATLELENFTPPSQKGCE